MLNIKIEKVIKTFKKSVKLNGFLKSLNFFFQLCLVKASIQNFIWINKKTRVFLRNGTSDIPVFRQIFLEGEYEFSYGEEIRTIIDAGANIGLAGVFYSLLYPEAKVICIEPEKENFNLLLKNTRGFKNIVAVNAGVWNKNDILQIEASERFGEWGFRLSERGGDDRNGCVKTFTIAKLMGVYGLSHLDVLKIDIEGAEKEVFLEGEVENWINSCRYIVIEMHEFLHPGIKEQILQKIASTISSRSFQLGENTVIINEEWIQNEDFCN